MSQVEESSSNFDPTDREAYAEILRKAGYVEIEQFAHQDLIYGYFCNTCQYFRKIEPRSPTGAWCEKLAAPDRAWGCCDYWQWTNLQNIPSFPDGKRELDTKRERSLDPSQAQEPIQETE